MSGPDERLARVAQEVLEAVAFMAAVPLDAAAAPPAAASFATAEVRFTGPLHGALRVAACPELRRGLAVSMLGLLDAEPTGAEQADALRELANILCGNLLPALTGDQAEFRLGPPELRPGFSAPAGARAASLALDGGRLELALLLGQDARPGGDGAP